MKTSAERQRAFKERMRKEGYVQVALWVKREKKDALLAFNEHLNRREK